MQLKNFKKNNLNQFNQYKYFCLYLFVFSFFTINLYSQGFVSSVVSLTGSVVNEITKQPETVSITVFTTFSPGIPLTTARKYHLTIFYIYFFLSKQFYSLSTTYKKSYFIELIPLI